MAVSSFSPADKPHFPLFPLCPPLETFLFSFFLSVNSPAHRFARQRIVRPTFLLARRPRRASLFPLVLGLLFVGQPLWDCNAMAWMVTFEDHFLVKGYFQGPAIRHKKGFT